jgi:hypothetical protein
MSEAKRADAGDVDQLLEVVGSGEQLSVSATKIAAQANFSTTTTASDSFRYIRDDGMEMIEIEPHWAVNEPYAKAFGLKVRDGAT